MQATETKPAMNPRSRFDYVKYDDNSAATQEIFKKRFEEIEELTLKLKSGRATALILTKLEETYMWVGKAIRDEQIHRNAATELQEMRCDS